MKVKPEKEQIKKGYSRVQERVKNWRQKCSIYTRLSYFNPGWNFSYNCKFFQVGISSWNFNPGWKSPYNQPLRRFMLNLDSNGWRLNPNYKSCRLTSSSTLTLHIQSNMARWFLNKRWISSHLRAQHSLKWSKAPLKKLLNSIPHLTDDIVEEERRARSSRNFPQAALVLAIVASSQLPPGNNSSPR